MKANRKNYITIKYNIKNMETVRAYKFRIYPRDVNAGINILKRATFGQRGSHALRDSIRPQVVAGIKELRTCSAIEEGSTRFGGWEVVT